MAGRRPRPERRCVSFGWHRHRSGNHRWWAAVRGASDISGAVGWFALNAEHREIYRQVGCWEAEAAGPGLARRMGAGTAEDVVALARKGDVAAKKAIEESALYLGMGIANIVSLLNPEMIVLGCGLMQAGDLFLAPVRRIMEQWAQPIRRLLVGVFCGAL